MRKTKILVPLALAASVMMAVTACGSKNTKETTAPTEAATEAEATVAPTTAESGADISSEENKEEKEAESEDEADVTEEEITEAAELSAKAGSIGEDGIFTAANGMYTITPPEGWVADGESDGEYVTFYAENDEDMLELVSITGEDAAFMLEEYPETAEEYKQLVSRGGGMDILSYDVKTAEDGSQTFRYSIRYPDAGDDVHYMAVSGAYNAEAETYVCATGSILSNDEGAADKVEAAVNSFKINP